MAAPLLLLLSALAALGALGLGDAAPPHGYTLEQLHVVFRHGNRTPEYPYPGDPNKDDTWEPTGWDQLSKAGIQSTYRLGLVFRQLYGSFLGDTYYQTDVNATSTDVPRTKLSLQAFMAGLFPAKNVQKWDSAGPLGHHWQPFVYHYMPKHLDDFLYMNGVDCPRYNKEAAVAARSDKLVQIFNSDAEMIRALREHGIDLTWQSVARFHCTVSIEAYEGRVVPEWVQPFYPERLERLALWHFHARIYTRALQRFKAGPVVKHMLSTMAEARAGAKKPRLWIYSGHDDSVTSVGMAVRTWGAVYPDFNAMIVLELLRKNSSGEYFVQVVQRESHAVEAHVVPVEGCSANPCPLHEFHELVKDVLPHDWRRECQLGDEKKRPQLLKPGAMVVNGTIPGKNKV